MYSFQVYHSGIFVSVVYYCLLQDINIIRFSLFNYQLQIILFPSTFFSFYSFIFTLEFQTEICLSYFFGKFDNKNSFFRIKVIFFINCNIGLICWTMVLFCKNAGGYINIVLFYYYRVIIIHSHNVHICSPITFQHRALIKYIKSKVAQNMWW